MRRKVKMSDKQKIRLLERRIKDAIRAKQLAASDRAEFINKFKDLYSDHTALIKDKFASDRLVRAIRAKFNGVNFTDLSARDFEIIQELVRAEMMHVTMLQIGMMVKAQPEDTRTFKYVDGKWEDNSGENSKAE